MKGIFNMTNCLVSIIVPCYNGEPFIDRCFASILAQTYKNIEVVVVNDGSTDGSAEKLLSYTEPFKAKGIRLNIVYQPNKGPGAAIDTGLKHITGEYLMLLDIDDLILPEAVECLVSAFSEDIALVRCDGFCVNESDIDKPIRKFTEADTKDSNTTLFEALVYGTTYNWAGSYMVKAEKLFEFYPDKSIYPSRYGQNLQMLMPVAYKGKDAFVDKPLMKYVLRDGSLSHGSNTAKCILGYMNIRLTLLDTIFEDDRKKEVYKKSVRIQSNNLLLELYCTEGNMAEAKKTFSAMKLDGAIAKSHRKLYYKYKLKHIFSPNKEETSK